MMTLEGYANFVTMRTRTFKRLSHKFGGSVSFPKNENDDDDDDDGASAGENGNVKATTTTTTTTTPTTTTTVAIVAVKRGGGIVRISINWLASKLTFGKAVVSISHGGGDDDDDDDDESEKSSAKKIVEALKKDDTIGKLIAFYGVEDGVINIVGTCVEGDTI